MKESNAGRSINSPYQAEIVNSPGAVILFADSVTSPLKPQKNTSKTENEAGDTSDKISFCLSLPPPVSDFTGHASVLASLKTLIADRKCNIIGFFGMGGIGKTALARKLAAELRGAYPDAAIELDLKGMGFKPLSQDDALNAILLALQPTENLPANTVALRVAVGNAIGKRRQIVLLDNVKDAKQIGPLLPLLQGSLTIITSRNRFVIPGATNVEVKALDPSDASKLIIGIAPTVSAEAASDLATACGYLPLALRLAASRLSVCPHIDPLKYSTEISSSLGRLKRIDKAKNYTTEELGLEASFELSYEQLSPELKLHFTEIAAFSDSFDQEAAIAVFGLGANPGAETIEALRALSLLEWNSVTRRFEIHDLLRDFALERISAENLNQAKRRHANHFIKVAEESDRLFLKGGNCLQLSLAMFDTERPHFESAFDWLSSSANEPASLIQLVDAVVYTGSLRFDFRQRIRWLEAEIKAAKASGDRKAESNAIGNLGLVYIRLRQPSKALGLFETALALDKELGNRAGQAADLGNIGIALEILDGIGRSMGFFRRALGMFRELGDKHGEASALGNIGDAYLASDLSEQAVECFQQQLKIAVDLEDRQSEGSALDHLGEVNLVLGKYAQAAAFYEQRISIARELKDRSSEGSALIDQGIAYSKLGDHPLAQDGFLRAIRLAQELGDETMEANSLWNLADEAITCGRHAEALERAEAALRIYLKISDKSKAKMVKAALASWRKQWKQA